jgi:trigger factor
MQIKSTNISETEISLAITAEDKDLSSLKKHVLEKMRKDVKVVGFRAGKAPLNLVEKNANPTTLQNEFLDEAINHLYSDTIKNQNLRPVSNPNITIKKFVPFTALEFTAEVSVIGKVTLTSYKTIKKVKPAVKPVTTKDTEAVIDSLQVRMGERKDVDRPAKEGDQIWIDFKGVDDKGQKVNGADGKDYPIVIGSNTFIPGFEPNLIGLKSGEDKSFTIPFPKDYQIKALASKKVTFSVQVIKVQEVSKPKVDDDFAAQVGPFKTAAELKTDVKKQLVEERKHQAERDFESVVLKEITDKSKVALPDALIDEEVAKSLDELKKNLAYRGQTYDEFLEGEKKTEKEYIETVARPEALDRIKASIVLSEIAELENVQITEGELTEQMNELRSRYTDPQTLSELSKPEAIRNLASRMVADKTIKKVVDYIAK